MTSKRKVYTTGFGNQSFSIQCNNDDAYQGAAFLFLDFPDVPEEPDETHHYDIVSSGPVPMLSLWEGDKQLYFGSSRYQLAYTLINEVIFHCINPNASHHAIHAGAVYKDNRCILLPGQSGNGKSTLTSWLLLNGYQYLTDELVFLTNDAQVVPFTRPISLKISPSHEAWLLPKQNNGEIITSDTGSMIPHRLFNPLFEAKQPQVTDIIFPQYEPGLPATLQEISPARGSLYLLKSHVNARNLGDHGIANLAAIARKCRSYTLSYGSFNDLPAFFTDSTSPFAP